MSYIVVDVESDGPCPGLFSMVCFGAVLVKDTTKTFFGKTRFITENWIPEDLAISGYTREEHLMFDHPLGEMVSFKKWIEEVSEGKPTFISDNLAFDWQWINYYFHKYTGENPFGFSGRRIGDLYCGLIKDAGKNWQWKEKYRKIIHDHNPVNDALGNAEALLTIKELGLKIKL